MALTYATFGHFIFNLYILLGTFNGYKYPKLNLHYYQFQLCDILKNCSSNPHVLLYAFCTFIRAIPGLNTLIDTMHGR